MASTLITLGDYELYRTPDFKDRIKSLISKITNKEEVLEGDRFRFGSALLIELIDFGSGQMILLVQWPDGLYRALPYELRAFVASLSVDINIMS